MRGFLCVVGIAAVAAMAGSSRANAQGDAAFAAAVEAVFSRSTPPAQPVDPDPTACCLRGECCRFSVLENNGLRTFARSANTLRTTTPETAAPPSPSPSAQSCFTQPLAPPLSTRRAASFYARSDHFKGCTQAAKSLLAMRTKNGKYTLSVKDIAPTKPEKQAYANVLTAYGRSCLNALDADDTVTLLKPATVAAIRDAVGYLYRDPRIPACTGAIVNGKILTARHCFLSQGSSTISVAADWRFRTFSGKSAGTPLAISSAIHQGALTIGDASDDWIVLDAPDIPAAPHLQLRAPARWEELLVPSFDPNALLIGLLGGAAAPTDFKAQLDLSPLCRIAALDDRLMLHACQTESGFSGSPLLAIDGMDQIAVVGLQAGRSESIAADCGSPLARFFPNYAVALPADLIERLGQPK